MRSLLLISKEVRRFALHDNPPKLVRLETSKEVIELKLQVSTDRFGLFDKSKELSWFTWQFSCVNNGLFEIFIVVKELNWQLTLVINGLLDRSRIEIWLLEQLIRFKFTLLDTSNTEILFEVHMSSRRPTKSWIPVKSDIDFTLTFKDSTVLMFELNTWPSIGPASNPRSIRACSKLLSGIWVNCAWAFKLTKQKNRLRSESFMIDIYVHSPVKKKKVFHSSYSIFIAFP